MISSPERSFLLLSVLFVLCFFHFYEISSAGEKEDLIQALMEMPSPAPIWRDPAEGIPLEKVQPDVTAMASPDDGSVDDLIRYWENRDYQSKDVPSEKVRLRLWEGIKGDPIKIPGLLEYLPNTPVVHDQLKQMLDAELNLPKLGQFWQEEVHVWLRRNSRYFRSELVQLAESAGRKPGWLEILNQDDVEALAMLDWDRCLSIIDRLLKSPDPVESTLALKLLYQHSLLVENPVDTDRWGNHLKDMVSDSGIPYRCREIAGEVLLESDWPGKDEWYLSLFLDESLVLISDEPSGTSQILPSLDTNVVFFYPLRIPVIADPEKWIPQIRQFVGSPNSHTHDMAVFCLIYYKLRSKRKDALEPLIPWLSNPDWSRAPDRLRLIQSVADLNLYESIPGLIWVVNNDPHEVCVAYAAQALKYLNAPEAGPAIKKALYRIMDSSYRKFLLSALFSKYNEFTVQELVDAIDSYVDYSIRPDKDPYDPYTGEKRPLEVEIGDYAVSYIENNPDLASALIQRAINNQDAGKEKNDFLMGLLRNQQSQNIDIAIVGQLEENPTAELLKLALYRQPLMERNIPDELMKLSAGQGVIGGFTGAILNDAERNEAILSDKDSLTIQAFLAAARLLRHDVPLGSISSILEKTDPETISIAKAYLEANDSSQAREMLIYHSPDDYLILGACDQFSEDACEGRFGDFEALLKEQIKEEDGPEEIYAFEHFVIDFGGSITDQVVLMRYPGRILLRKRLDESRYWQREFKIEEWEELTELIEENNYENLDLAFPIEFEPSYTMGYADSELLHLTKKSGRRVAYDLFLFSGGQMFGVFDGEASTYRIPGTSLGPTLLKLSDYFEKLFGEELTEKHYYAEDSIEGLQIHFHNPEYSVLAVHKNKENLKTYLKNQSGHSLGWFEIDNSHILSKTDQPAGFYLNEIQSIPRGYGGNEVYLNSSLWLKRLNKEYLLQGNWEDYDRDGLWLWDGQDKIEPYLLGSYGNPSVSSDARWILAYTASPRNNYGFDFKCVLIEADKKTIYQIDTGDPLSDCSFGIYSPLNEKFILRTFKHKAGSYREIETNYSFDPISKSLELTSGKFRPLIHQSYRPLQKAKLKDYYWAAIPNEEAFSTDIGLYREKDFSFRKLLTIPKLLFDSMDLWVDESEGKGYITFEEDILTIPIEIPTVN